jgi:hypothetical protein
MAARLQFKANLLGEVALVFDDQNRSGGQSVRWPSRRPVTFCYVNESTSCRLLAFI